MYLGYTTTLASFLSLEFKRLNHPDKSQILQVFQEIYHQHCSAKIHQGHQKAALCLVLQGSQMEREEMKLLSLLLAPVARIHSYLSHIQVSQQPEQIQF